MITALPDASAFQRKIKGIACGTSALGPAILALAVAGLLRLTSEQWVWIAALTSGYMLLTAALLSRTSAHGVAPIRKFLAGRASGEVTDAEVLEAFSAAVELPRNLAKQITMGWVAACALVSISMGIRSGGPSC